MASHVTVFEQLLATVTAVSAVGAGPSVHSTELVGWLVHAQPGTVAYLMFEILDVSGLPPGAVSGATWKR